MKIIGGFLRSRNLYSPKISAVRPTTGVVREALFNICQNTIEGAVFLDLFAGSGAIGIEALSRGAKEVVFVDENRSAINVIQKNLKSLELNNYKLICEEATHFLKRWRQSFDVIYIDPPYEIEADIIKGLIEIIMQKNLLTEHGILFVERALCYTKEDFVVPGLSHKKTRRFGKTMLHELENV